MPTDELLIRQMPHSPEAEQSVLGAVLMDSSAMTELSLIHI